MDRTSIHTDLDQAVAFIIRRTSRSLRVYLNRILSDSEFEGGSEQWLILVRLRQAASLLQGELKADNLDDRANISRQIKALQTLGYIKVKADVQDGRKKNISLSTKGIKLVDKLMPLMVEERKRLFNQFTSEELETVVNVLNRLETTITEQ